MSQENTAVKTGKPLFRMRLGVWNNVVIAVAVVISVILLYATHQTIESYHDLQDATSRYITCQQDALLFREASDYLTQESRYFALTGNLENARNFMEEIETTRRREQVLNDFDSFLQEEQSYSFLVQALEYSNQLAETELYAIRLTAAGYGCAPEEIPEGVLSVELRAEDAALSAEAQRAKAVEMLFNEDYVSQKHSIYSNVEQSINALVEDTRRQQVDSAEGLNRLLRRQQVLIALLLVMLFAVVVLTYVLIIRPLRTSVIHIRAKQLIPVSGSYEMQFLASTYNDIFEQNTQHQEKLTYSATHDSLTGVYNRTAYDSYYASLDQSQAALLIIDIDKFKDYNDKYGHDVGDRVLQRVAQVLTDSFRSSDFVSRIGGDEFCVIMGKMNSSLRQLVAGKIDRANELLQHPADGLPKISLSVGAAFGDRENPSGDLFKDADTALYRVKENGRARCGFY